MVNMANPIAPITPKIFISHAWEDKIFVRRLEAELKSAGAEVWVDHSDLQGGDNLPKRISDALTWCDTVLFVWSEAASQSHWVELEWTNALSLRKTIIPCVVSKTPLPALLANVLYVDCRDFAKGFAQLQQALHLDPSATKPEPAPASTTKDRRIDAAVPSAAELGRAIDLRVQVRFPDSPRLGLEDWPAKTKPAQLEQISENVVLEFPVDAATGKLAAARLEIHVIAPDFDIAGTAKQILLVPPDALSKCLSFLITPKRTGVCRLNVEVYNLEHIFLGAIPIETEVGNEPKSPSTNVANLFLFVTVRQEQAVTRSGGTYSKTKKIQRPAPKIEPKEIPPPAPAPSQTGTGGDSQIIQHSAKETPIYQRAWRWLIFILIGIFAVGGFFDAIANALLLVTPRSTYFFSIAIIVIWVCLEMLLRRRGLLWLTKDRKAVRIRRLGNKVKGALIGVMVLLWLPRVADIFDLNLIKDETPESSRFYGVVEDENGKLIADAEIIITVKEGESDRLGYGRTKLDGEFDLVVKAKPQTTLWVTVIKDGVIGFQNYLPILGNQEIIFKGNHSPDKP